MQRMVGMNEANELVHGREACRALRGEMIRVTRKPM